MFMWFAMRTKPALKNIPLCYLQWKRSFILNDEEEEEGSEYNFMLRCEKRYHI